MVSVGTVTTSKDTVPPVAGSPDELRAIWRVARNARAENHRASLAELAKSCYRAIAGLLPALLPPTLERAHMKEIPLYVTQLELGQLIAALDTHIDRLDRSAKQHPEGEIRDNMIAIKKRYEDLMKKVQRYDTTKERPR